MQLQQEKHICKYNLLRKCRLRSSDYLVQHFKNCWIKKLSFACGSFLQQTSVYFPPHRSYYLYHYGKRRCSLWQISLGKGYSAARIPSPSLQRLPLPAKKKGKGRCLPASTASVLTAISDRLPGNRQKELYNGKRFSRH